MEERPPRKLAVILHADVVGSTMLVQFDETLAHERIQDAFRRFSETINTYGGVLHEIRGDALVAEFARASDAVCAALSFQQSNTEHNAQFSDEIVPVVRVGIALGEEVFADDTVTGVGVVLAQRVEQLSEPGGVGVTGAIHEAIAHRMPFDQESLGEQEVKGFEEPVRVYRVALKPGEVVPEAETSKQIQSPSQTRRLIVAFAAVALVVAGGAAYWFKPWMLQEESASVERMALPLPDKPSIVVLPFINISDDPQQEYFADGMTDDLITDLSKISGLFVIARHSSFAYKDKSPNVHQVSRELGVKYVLEGSVRRAGDEIRVNAQLIDATTGGHLWAERFDRPYADIFALQDEVIGRIVSAFTLKLTPAEQNQIGRKPTDNLEAYEHYLRAEQGFRSNTLAGLSIAMREYEKAVALDPNFAEAYAGHAHAAVEYLQIVERVVIPANKARQVAYESVSRALALDPNLSRAHSVLSILHTFNSEHEEAVESATRAVSLDPNSAEGYSNLALVLMYAGQIPEAVHALETALRLSPNPSIRVLGIKGQVLFMSRQYQRALDALTRVQGSEPFLPSGWITAEAPLFRAMAYAQLDLPDEARKVLDGRFRRTEWINIEYLRHLWSHYKRPEDLEHLLNSLRRAGLSEWPPGYEVITGDRLKGAEITDLLFGYVWVGRSQNNYETFTQSTSVGGEVVYRQFGRTWPGRVFVKNDTLCYQIAALLLGREFCGNIYRNAQGTPEERNEYIAVDVFDIHHFAVR